jgi:AmiR/NasT family two-component response regulator
VLIRTRRLSETAAYALMRATAMSQSKRIFEFAEAVVNMAEILKA